MAASYAEWRQRAKHWQSLYFSTQYELAAPPTELESYYIPCEQLSGLLRFLGVILVSPSGLRFVGQKYEKPPEILPFQALVFMAPLSEVSVSIAPRSWWRSRGFGNARQRVQITWPNNTLYFWIPTPEVAVAELQRVIQELKVVTSASPTQP
jgi:hypothetical protein